MSAAVKMLVVELTSASLREYLGMPAEAEIVGAHMVADCRGVLQITVRGIGPEVPEGGHLQMGHINVTSGIAADGNRTRDSFEWRWS